MDYDLIVETMNEVIVARQPARGGPRAGIPHAQICSAYSDERLSLLLEVACLQNPRGNKKSLRFPASSGWHDGIEPMALSEPESKVSRTLPSVVAPGEPAGPAGGRSRLRSLWQLTRKKPDILSRMSKLFQSREDKKVRPVKD